MKMWHFALITLAFFTLYSFVFIFTKKKKPFKRAFLTMLMGLLSLAAVDISGMFTGVSLSISPLTLTASACGGVPAVAAMVIMNFLL